jgi:recombination protein RecA
VYSDRLFGAAKNLKKDYNAGNNRTQDYRISTGSVVLDVALGSPKYKTALGAPAGLPVGRHTLFWGEKSGGKSTSAARAIATNQNLCRRCFRPAKDVEVFSPPKEILDKYPEARWSASGKCDCVGKGLVKVEDPKREKGETPKKYNERIIQWREDINKNSYEEFICAWVDPEDAYDVGWATEVGVDDRRLYYVRPDTGEEASDIVQVLFESGQVDFIVIDSLAHFTPRVEIKKGAEEWQQGLQARLVNKGIRGWVSMNARNKNNYLYVTSIWLNQSRMKIGVLFGNPETKPAGRGQDFAIHAEIKFLSSKVEAVSEQFGGEKEKNVFPVTEEIHFKVTKNKTAPTRGFEGRFKQTMRSTEAVPAGTVIEDDWIFKNAMKYLVVQHENPKKGQGKYEIAGEQFKTQVALRAAITGSGELAQVVRQALVKELASAR